MVHSLVLKPQTAFEHLDAHMGALGWQRQTDSLVAAPLVPGEPELASWYAADANVRVSYTFNPVVNLRVLSFSAHVTATDRYELAQDLPILHQADIAKLLRSDSPLECLLGIFSTVELNAFEFLSLLDSLRAHSDTNVARAADNAHQRLTQRLVEQGVQHLQAQQRQQPDRSALFSHAGSVRERRQMLRWLARDYRAANPEILKVLRSALTDADWEIRVTAMLGAARLGARELGPEIRHLALPQGRQEGLDREDRGLLLALRKAVLAELAGEGIREQELAPGEAPIDKAAMWVHLRRCVAGQPVYLDPAALWVHALSTPVETVEAAPIFTSTI